MGKLIIYGNQNLVKGYTKSFIAMFKEFFAMPKIAEYLRIIRKIPDPVGTESNWRGLKKYKKENLKI